MTIETRQDDGAQAIEEPKGLGLSRPVLKRATADREPGAQIAVTVTLRIGREHVKGASSGVGHDTIEMRVAAEATIRALNAAIGEDYFELLGLKRMHAFDADVILVALRGREDPAHRFIGAVPVRSTLVNAAAAAVLDATNRVVTKPID